MARERSAGAAEPAPPRPLYMQQCRRCGGRGFITKPCSLCGRLAGGFASVSLWSESEKRAAWGDR